MVTYRIPIEIVRGEAWAAFWQALAELRLKRAWHLAKLLIELRP